MGGTMETPNICIIYENAAFVQIVEKTVRKGCSLHTVSLTELIADAAGMLETLKAHPWDYIVIGAREELGVLTKKLLVQYGSCSRDTIIDFYRSYDCMLQIPKIQKVMRNPRYFDLKGLIMGLSHAETGIVSSMFPQKTCNIATGGQDLYYNLKSLQWCIQNHYHHLRDLEYVILDLYDYSYFNVDTSRGKNAVNYFVNWDGYIWDGHQFDENKNFNYDFKHLQEELYAYTHSGLETGEAERFQFLFPEAMSLTNYEEYEDDFKVKHIAQVVTQEELDAYVIDSSVMKKIFSDTWQENVRSLEEILILLRELNPNMKIKMVLMPRCQCIEERMEPYDRELKPKFFGVLHELQKSYRFEIFDLKDLEEISAHREFYYDSEHLNRSGAESFTKYFIQNCMDSVYNEKQI